MFFLLLEILFHKYLIFNTISYSLKIWVKYLLPSMFPVFVISDILIQYDITNYIPKWIKKTFSNIFSVRDSIITIFFLSWISGFPSNARMIRKMYDRKEISTSEANHALIFTHFSNPMFVLSTVAVLFLHHESYGYIILLSHYLGNIILGIITKKNLPYNHIDYTKKTIKSQNFSKIFIESIQSAIDTLLLILGILTCFLITSSLLIHMFQFSSYTGAIIKGIIEITMGLKEISLLKIPDIYKIVISTVLISFGGLSVHLQVLSQIINSKISYHYFFVARIFHAIISGFICFILYYVLQI